MKIINNNNFYLTEWLASASGTKFSKPTEEMSKEEVCFFRVVLHIYKKERWHIVNEIYLRAAIEHLLPLLLLNKPFSEANLVLKHL